MDKTALKVLLLSIMVSLTLFFGLLPVKVLKMLRQRAASPEFLDSKGPSLMLCLLTCFTGGVFLSTCFLHLLPEATEHVEGIKAQYHWHTDYPVAELIACLGFFLVFFIEEMVLWLIKRRGGNANHGPSITHVHHHIDTGSCHEVDTSTEQAQPLHMHNGGTPDITKHAGGRKGSARLECATMNTRLNVSGSSADSLPGGLDEKARLNGAGHVDKDNACMTTASPCCGELFHQEFEHMSGTTEVCHVVHAEPECCEEPCTNRECDNPPIKMRYKPHAHHHGVRSFTLVLALSIHSIFEGLAFGIQDSSQSVALLFTSIMLHKCIVAFSVGLQLARTHSHQVKWVVFSVLGLALMSPLGAAVGIGVAGIESEGKDIVLMAFEGLCVGTFIYVTFFEVFAHERDNEHPNMLKLLVTIIGFSIIALIRIMEHGHSHGPTAGPPGASPGDANPFNQSATEPLVDEHAGHGHSH